MAKKRNYRGQIPAFVDKNIWKDSLIIHRKEDGIMWIRDNILSNASPSPSVSSEESGDSSGSEGRKLRPKKITNYFPPHRPIKSVSDEQDKIYSYDRGDRQTKKEQSIESNNKRKTHVSKGKRAGLPANSITSKKPKSASPEKLVGPSRGKILETAYIKPLREQPIALDFRIESPQLIRDQRDLNSEPIVDRPKMLPIILPPERMKPIVAELIREESFSASHRLNNPYMSRIQNIKVFDKCNWDNGHGHNYRVKVFLRGPINNHTGMVYNMKDLKEEMKLVINSLDHKNIDEDVPFFKTRVSTSENLALYFVISMREVMAAPQLLHKIKLWETDKNSVVLYSSDVCVHC